MSDGLTHARASLALAIPVTIVAVRLADGDPAALAAGLGCAAGVFLSPDLDQESLDYSEWLVVRWLGPLGFAWLAFWWGYARLIPHRHIISHSPVVGTLGRLFYLSLPAIIALALGWTPPHLPPWAGRAAGWAVFGLAVSDAAHFLFDALPGGERARRRRRSG